MKKICVTGGGGFIGFHLIKKLKELGFWVRGVDIKYPEFGKTLADEFMILDLRKAKNAVKALNRVEEVYALAANMGGMGFISKFHSEILRDNLLININTIEAARMLGIEKYLFTSSACVYPNYKQNETDILPLKEEDAYPADPQDAYGWEKLTTEKLCEYYGKQYPIDFRVVRFHNIYGPFGCFDGGREKAPAALCRKVALAKDGEDIEVWGDGKATRSFCYIDDCIKALIDVMNKGDNKPINIGRDDLISVEELAKLIIKISGKKLGIKFIEGPQGVRGRNSDNTKFKNMFNWEPSIPLEEGLKITYEWIKSEVSKMPCGGKKKK